MDDSVEGENEIEEQSGRPIRRQIPESQQGKWFKHNGLPFPIFQ